MIKTSPASRGFGTVTYVKLGCATIARFAGSVHGVVVQITSAARWPWTGSTSGIRTYTDGDVLSLYSISASASAVLSRVHQ